MKNIIHKITNWEAWPFKLLYAPLVPFWVWYMLRSRSVWFFTPSNPKITFGGMDGEPKSEMYALLRKELFPKTVFVSTSMTMELISELISKADIQFPLIAKPDIGCQGILFRKFPLVKSFTMWLFCQSPI